MFEKSTPASDRARRNMRAPITLLAAMLVLVGCTAKKSTPPPAATTAIATATEASGAETTTPTTGGPAPSALSAVTRREPLKMTDPGDGRPPITLFIDRTADQTTVNGTVAAPSGGGRFGVSVAAAPAFMKGSGYIGKDGRLWHDLSQKSPGQGKATDQSYPNGDRRITDPDGSTKTWRNDGSFDYVDKDGSWTHVNPDGGGSVEEPGGSRTEYQPEDNGDRTAKQFDKDGNLETQRRTDPEGNDVPIPDAPGSLDGDAPTDPLERSGESGPIPDDNTDGPTEPFGENGPKKPAGGTGEPHFETEDGAIVTSQRIGDFVLSNGITGRSLQARITPWNGSTSVSAITSLAVGFGADRLVVNADGSVSVNGSAAPTGLNMGYGADGGILGVYRDEAAGPVITVGVMFTDLSILWITPHGNPGVKWLNFVWQGSSATGQSKGILGIDDEVEANDLTGRDGTVAVSDDASGVDAFVRSWRVADGESMFATPFPTIAGIDAANLDAFPSASGAPTPGSMDQATIDAACSAVSSKLAKTACAYDLAKTGEKEFAAGAIAFDARFVGATARAGALKAFDIFQALRSRRPAAPTTTSSPTTLLTTPPTTPKGPGTMTLSAAERAGAKTVPADSDAFDATLIAGQVLVLRVEGTAGRQVGALNSNLSCVGDPYVGGGAGLALFDEGGSSLGPAVAACGELRLVTVTGAAVFLKLVGPATFDLRFDVL